ncbi:PREDICTED: protein myomaker-like, partial [Bison bison bison]|uniref:Protein myomaker-like n=1 Tax=Bison bison bison TaxID=43346 RepID=A0A6P3HLM7_BISBB
MWDSPPQWGFGGPYGRAVQSAPVFQLHHACTGPGLSLLCLLRHDILEYFSVYGTALSMWVSLMALADFDEPKRSTFVMFGVLTIAVRIYHDRWGYGVYSGPIGSAILIIAAKWVRTCEPQRSGRLPWRRLFPLG